MGGNKGKRTKGNVKPSSSGRSAELLSAAGVTGFIGFSGISTDLPGSVVPSGKQTESEEIEATVDNDFKLVLKKATKRDTITKVKALQEFAQLCQTKDDIAVKGALPFWPRLYAKLAIDHDRRVRESSHQAHKCLVSKVKKNIAPYLKSLMGPWVVSMCDLYAPAASAAKQAFQIAFPVPKQAEALEFCKDEIISYVEDVLFHQTAATLSDPKLCDPEEMEMKYIRLIAGCLNGLTFFLTTQKSTSNIELFNRILLEPKYWKYAKHKDPEIRKAWFSLVAILSQYYPDLIRESAAKVCPLTLSQLGEDNPIVIPAIWDSILHILALIENCWDHLNIDSAFLPPLWTILSEGGKGNASTTFQNMLPLLSKLPASVTEPRIPFYERFYGCFKTGMFYDKSQLVASESRAIIKAYFECLQYSLLQHLTDSAEDANCRAHLINDQLITVIKDSLATDEMCKSGTLNLLYDNLGDFLHTLNTQVQKNTSAQDCLSQSLCEFSAQIFQIGKDILDSGNTNDVERTLSKLSLFFRCLFSTLDKKKSKKVSVRFGSDKMGGDLDRKPKYRRDCGILAQETVKLCHAIFCKLQEEPKLSFLNLFCETVKVSTSAKLFDDLLRLKEGMQVSCSQGEAPVVFVKVVLVPWLVSREELFGDSEAALKCIVSVILSASSCLSEGETLALLDDLGKVSDQSTLEGLVIEAAELRQKEPRLRKWLKGDFVGNLMMQLANSLSEQLLGNEKESQELIPGGKLLHICFTATKDFDPLISAEYMNRILNSFTLVLAGLLPVRSSSKKIELSEKIIKLVCDLAVNLFKSCQGCLLLPTVESLLLSLFKLSCCLTDRETSIWNTLQETWAFGTSKMVEQQGLDLDEQSFVVKAADALNKILIEKEFHYENCNELGFLSEKVCCLIQSCLSGLKKRDDELDYGVAQKLTNQILGIVLPKRHDWLRAEEDFLSECIFMRLYVLPVGAELPWVCYSSKDLEKGIKKFLIYSKLTLDVLRKLQDGSVVGDLDNSLQEENFVASQCLYHLPHLIMAVGFIQESSVNSEVACGHPIRALYDSIPLQTCLLLETLTEEQIELALSEISKRAIEGFFPHTKALSVMLSLGVKNEFFRAEWCDSFAVECHLFRLVSLGHYEVLYKIHSLLPFLSVESVASLITQSTLQLISDEKVVQGIETCCMDVLSMCFSSICTEPCIQRRKFKSLRQQPTVREDLSTLLVFLYNLRKTSPQVFNPEWDEYEIWFVNHLCSLFHAAIKHFPELMTHEYWDMILCSIVTWLERCQEAASGSLFMEPNMAAILTFQLLCLVKKLLPELDGSEENFEPALLAEWNELYLENIFSQVLPLFLSLNDHLEKLENTPRVKKLLTAIGHSVEGLPSELILKCLPKGAAEFQAVDSLPSDLSFLLERLYSLLMSSNRPVVLGAHAILLSVIHKIPGAQVLEEQVETQEQKSRPPPKHLLTTLQSTGQVVEVMIQGFQVGDCCLVQPQTDTFTFTYVYLLTWVQMLQLFWAADSELRSEYALYLENSKLLDGLLLNLFKLMPDIPSLPGETQKCLSPTSSSTMFTEPSPIYTNEWTTFSELQHLACQVYLLTLEHLPALVRQWWLNQDKRTAEIVNKYTTCFVSPCISFQEIKAVQDTDTKFSNMTVRGRPVAREVVAKYIMEEITFELIIRLPPNHPLGPVAIETGQRIGVGNTQWRNWMLQLTTFLTHQNGSILDGLSLWKRNVDKRFEGIEECMICFYVLHGATCQLPKLTCRTCKKKFHPACLYKWFNTSQNSSCPLCRNLF